MSYFEDMTGQNYSEFKKRNSDCKIPEESKVMHDISSTPEYIRRFWQTRGKNLERQRIREAWEKLKANEELIGFLTDEAKEEFEKVFENE